MVNARTADERLTYMIFGRLGQLIPSLTGPNATGAIINDFVTHNVGQDVLNADPIVDVFDTEQKRWVRVLFNDIPWTYSFVPKPHNTVFELDYWVRSCGLVKHQFIWSVPSIPAATFARVSAPQNREMLGRYTTMPWLPLIKDLIRFESGFRQFADNGFMCGFLEEQQTAPPASQTPPAA